MARRRVTYSKFLVRHLGRYSRWMALRVLFDMKSVLAYDVNYYSQRFGDC